MPEAVAPVAPAAPAAPSTPAPAVSSTPAAPAPPASVPATPAAPATPSEAAAPATPATPAKYDPKTAADPPKSTDYPDSPEGILQFAHDRNEWTSNHEEAAEKLRQAKVAAEEGMQVPAGGPEAATVEAVKAAEGEQPAEPAKPAGEAVAAATPAVIDEWTTKSPELKAAFEKSPELQSAIMGMARENESAKAVLEVVSTKEEAKFAVDHANRLIGLQTAWMLSNEDPEMVGPAWDQTVDMFKTRDAQGKEILGQDGKPQLDADFKPFVRKAATSAISEFQDEANSQIAMIQARLKGSYPSDDAREADEKALEQATYNKAAFDYVTEILNGGGQSAALPALPPDATDAQKAFQEKLKKEREELDAKQGKQTAESRKAARAVIDRDVDRSWSKTINDHIESHVKAMTDRGEYLPDYVLNDKWINPQTGKATAVTDLGARCYLALNAKIDSVPSEKAELARLQMMGAAGKEAREKRLAELTTKYLPKILDGRITEIQNGIRGAQKKKEPASEKTIARVEPQTAGTVVPSAMNQQQVRTWAETEAKKDPNYGAMSSTDRETLIISLAAKKRYGG
jgi:hypothetical protein